MPSLTLPLKTKSKEGGFDHEVDVSIKLTLRALLLIAVVLHIISVPVDSLITYLTAASGAAAGLLP